MTPQDILKTSIKKYANDNFSNNKRTFILSKWAKGAPFSQEQIDEIRKASALEKEEAKEHIQNSWAALGNNLPGDVIKESYLA